MNYPAMKEHDRSEITRVLSAMHSGGWGVPSYDYGEGPEEFDGTVKLLRDLHWAGSGTVTWETCGRTVTAYIILGNGPGETIADAWGDETGLRVINPDLA